MGMVYPILMEGEEGAWFVSSRQSETYQPNNILEPYHVINGYSNDVMSQLHDYMLYTDCTISYMKIYDSSNLQHKFF